MTEEVNSRPPASVGASDASDVQPDDIGLALFERIMWPLSLSTQTLIDPATKKPVLHTMLLDVANRVVVRGIPTLPEGIGLLALLNHMWEMLPLEVRVKKAASPSAEEVAAKLAAEAPASAAAGNCHEGLRFVVTGHMAGVPEEQAAEYPPGQIYDHSHFPTWVRYLQHPDANLTPEAVEKLLLRHQECPVCFPTKSVEVDTRAAPGA